MAGVYQGLIDHPAAWTSKAIGGKAGLIRRISPTAVAALREAVDRSRDRKPWETTRADFSAPALAELMAGVRDEIMHGRGAIILDGLDMGSTPLEDYERIYWGLGTHLGAGVVQSYRGDRIGHVQKEKENPTGRGYLMDIELRFHTDFHEVLSLAGFRRAETGGDSGLCSSLAVHNAIYQTRPDLLEPLYEGFFHKFGEDDPVSQTKVPVFCNVEGVVSCYYHRLFMTRAAEALGVELPERLIEAMEHFNAMAAREDVSAEFMLEPGEMMFWHNFTALHARRAFTDSAAHKRLLLRLWLNVPDGRPMAPEFNDRARSMDEAHEAGRAAIRYAQFADADLAAAE